MTSVDLSADGGALALVQGGRVRVYGTRRLIAEPAPRYAELRLAPRAPPSVRPGCMH